MRAIELTSCSLVRPGGAMSFVTFFPLLPIFLSLPRGSFLNVISGRTPVTMRWHATPAGPLPADPASHNFHRGRCMKCLDPGNVRRVKVRGFVRGRGRRGRERERGGDARVYLIVDDFNHPASGTNQMNRWNVKVYLISKSRYLPRSKCNFEWNAGFEPPPPFLNPFLARLASSTRFHMHSWISCKS